MALLAATGLAWEVALTRLASALLSYHYAFVVVSLALGGLGIGAALVYALPGQRAAQAAQPAALGAALAFLLAALLLPPAAQQGIAAMLVALAALPFLALGAATAALFSARAVPASRLYAADLAGAGVGAAVVVLALNTVGPFAVSFGLAAADAAAALLLAANIRAAQPRLAAALALAAALVGAGLQATAAPLGISYTSLRNAPPDKTIVPLLRDASQRARIISTHWDAFARTDVVATADPSRRFVFTDGGAGTYMVRWTPADTAPLRDDLETLPLLLGPHDRVLVIGAGGGIDVARALVAGARQITAVELNGATVAAVRAEGAYNGNILDRPGVTTVVDDGRHFLARDHGRYDVILLNLVYSGAAEGTSHALSESYIFTTQAFRCYLAHLAPRGRIGIISHQALEGLRAFTTGVEALHQNGLSYQDAMLRASVLMTDNQTPEARPTLTLIQGSAFNQRELNLLHARGVGDLNLRPLYVPFLFSGDFVDLAGGRQTLAEFLRGSDYAIGPTSDDRPFFFDLNLGLPEGLGAALWYAVLPVAGLIALALLLREGPPAAPRRAIWLLGLYMACLGGGFMCVEVPVIQRFILVLGSPVLAMTVVLCVLLLAGGLGSALAGRLSDRPRALVAAPLVALLLSGLAALLPGLTDLLVPLGRTAAIVGAAAVLAPLGVALGLPFPAGLRLAGRLLPGDLPLFWSLNALCSVVGSVVAAVIAVQFGFAAVLLAGAACYAVAATAMGALAAA